ncbi:MAG: hypothetical protein WBZ37_18410 [Mycobacterium sp.]
MAKVAPSGPGPVEVAIQAEVAGLAAAESRPGLVAAALALGKLLDGRAVSSMPAAAGRLVAIMDELHKGAAPRVGRLKLVKAMTTPDGGGA